MEGTEKNLTFGFFMLRYLTPILTANCLPDLFKSLPKTEDCVFSGPYPYFPYSSSWPLRKANTPDVFQLD